MSKVTITRYIPCPVCHDSGGGGKLEKWETNKSIAFVCDECSSTWSDRDQFLLGENLLLHAWSVKYNQHLTNKVEFNLFKIDDQNLEILVLENLAPIKLKFVKEISRRLTYWTFRPEEPISINGSDKLMVITYQGFPHLYNVFPSGYVL